jgi:hypothetical protein
VRFLVSAGVLVLIGIWFVGGSSAMPPGVNQFAPPPTPRPGEVSVSLSAADLSQRLGVPVSMVPNQLTVNSAVGHVELQRGHAVAVFGPADVRTAVQRLLDAERDRAGLGYVRSVAITDRELLLIGSR